MRYGFKGICLIGKAGRKRQNNLVTSTDLKRRSNKEERE